MIKEKKKKNHIELEEIIISENINLINPHRIFSRLTFQDTILFITKEYVLNDAGEKAGTFQLPNQI